MSLLPAYASSLLSPFLNGNDGLGLSMNPYQQLQSLIPLSMSTPSQSNSPFSIDATSFLTDQFPTNPLLSLEACSTTSATKTSDTVTISSSYKSYDVANHQSSKVHSKKPFKSITNQALNSNLSNKHEKEEYEIPKKKIKHEEINTVTKFSEPIHYLFPN